MCLIQDESGSSSRSKRLLVLPVGDLNPQGADFAPRLLALSWWLQNILPMPGEKLNFLMWPSRRFLTTTTQVFCFGCDRGSMIQLHRADPKTPDARLGSCWWLQSIRHPRCSEGLVVADMSLGLWASRRTILHGRRTLCHATHLYLYFLHCHLLQIEQLRLRLICALTTRRSIYYHTSCHFHIHHIHGP